MNEHKKWCHLAQGCQCGAREEKDYPLMTYNGETGEINYPDESLAAARQQGREEERAKIEKILLYWKELLQTSDPELHHDTIFSISLIVKNLLSYEENS